MKISLNWLADYITHLPKEEQLSDILTEIGLEVEGVEKVESIKGGLEGVVVGEVLTSEKHPNADRLSVNEVDTGGDGPLHIVCGAPNVTAGQKVLVAVVGTALYDKDGKAWKIKKSKIRGALSEGMICAEDELGLGDDHSGILVLPDNIEIGTLAKDYFGVSTDTVFDIGLTPNRSDATSHIGVAKDLVASLIVNHKFDGALNLPSVDHFSISDRVSDISVEVMNSEACPRYTGVVITNLIVQESPAWLRNRLSSIGVRPINNVVDVTNFVLHETGQPLHAFDLSKIAGGKIVVQTLKEGSLFVTLDEQERELSSTDLMICNGLSEGMCIGGVFGGIHTGVTERTQSIFLESAHFHPAWIRRTSDRHNLYTDASRTFEKGSDPNICLYALKRAAMLLEELAGGRVSSEVKDIYPSPILPAQIRLEFSHLNRLVGKDIVPDKIKGILSAMNMQILDVDESGLLVGVPTDKADVQREVDLIEEVLRIYGFNNIPMPSQMSISVTTTERPDPLQVRNRVADYLVSQGCNEMMGMSMVDNRYFENTFQLAESELVRINNTSNVQVEVMRPSMLISALEAVLHNQNRQQTNLRLFEFGYSYRKGEAGFDEKHHLTITSTSWEQESWHNDGQRPGHTFYALKSLVESVLAMLGVDSWHTEQMSDEWHVYGLQYENKGGTRIVTVGKVAETICSQLDIRSDVYYAEFDWNHLMMSSTIDKVEVKSVSKYPTVRRDMALVVDKSTAFDVIRSILLKGQKEVREVNLFDVFEDAKVIGEGKKSYAISLVFGDETKTLSDKEVDKSMAALVERCQQDLGAKLR